MDTDFDPDVYGFRFANRFSGGNVVAELARQERLSDSATTNPVVQLAMFP